jgi:hypothetical protein
VTVTLDRRKHATSIGIMAARMVADPEHAIETLRGVLADIRRDLIERDGWTEAEADRWTALFALAVHDRLDAIPRSGSMH